MPSRIRNNCYVLSNIGRNGKRIGPPTGRYFMGQKPGMPLQGLFYALCVYSRPIDCFNLIGGWLHHKFLWYLHLDGVIALESSWYYHLFTSNLQQN